MADMDLMTVNDELGEITTPADQILAETDVSNGTASFFKAAGAAAVGTGFVLLLAKGIKKGYEFGKKFYYVKKAEREAGKLAKQDYDRENPEAIVEAAKKGGNKR